ncbi:MAG: LysM peptidoglycan-binding domain-containing protein [Clostridia bacterium]|nr:LysM peptidoglycan-binding domain-containing protein [Clostridia bacterium]
MQNQGRICPRGASYYTWKQGDTLASVARVNGTTAQAVQVINEDVDFSSIAPGTEICIPSQVYTCITGRAYAVQSGETFQSIADKLGITVYELQERNPGVDANNLTIGQVICIPDASTSAPSQPQQPTQPPATVPPTPSFSCPVGYEARSVRTGQTYADLLQELNVSYRAMRTANPTLRPGGLVSGMRYCAPPAGTRQICSGTRTYTIQPDENLDVLAANLRTTKGRLLMLNPTLLPSDFSSGTVICVPLT